MLEAIASSLEAIASRLEAIAIRLEALEAIALRLEAIASRLEAIVLNRLRLPGPGWEDWRPSTRFIGGLRSQVGVVIAIRLEAITYAHWRP